MQPQKFLMPTDDLPYTPDKVREVEELIALLEEDRARPMSLNAGEIAVMLRETHRLNAKLLDVMGKDGW